VIMGTEDKILSRDELGRVLAARRLRRERIVFTNGVFDIIHAGHVRYLEAARALGDVLVVAVNGDASAARLAKGPGRPFNGERDRARVLAALACVDYVTVFEEDTPLAAITALVPDVLAKGGDWAPADIIGADVVRAAGGEVLALPFAAGYSTSALVSRILAARRGAERGGADAP
jgi:rfaE bifunctional protein nucleotidyltransferase chain/domain